MDGDSLQLNWESGPCLVILALVWENYESNSSFWSSLAQAHLGDFVGLVPGPYNKENIAVKRVPQLFWFPSTCESYVHTIL